MPAPPTTEPTTKCCVCGDLLSEAQVHTLGPRAFCAQHYGAALDRATRSGWSRVGLIEIGLVAAFVAAVARTLGTGAEATLPTSIGVGMVMAVVPAVILLVYIYRRDLIEPEPLVVVLGIFALGGLVGHGVATPVIEDVFQISEWQHRSPVAGLVATLALVGGVQQFATYLAVRYSVYLTSEFDEVLDGAVYAGAAALGLATVSNVDFILRNDGVLPVAGAIYVASNALVHLAAGVVLGYGMGLARFQGRKGQLWLGGCFAASILLNGGLRHLATFVAIDGGRFDPWLGLAVALGFGAAVLIGLDLLTARVRRETLRA